MFGRFLFFTSQNDPIVLQCCGMAKRLDDHVRNKCFHPSGVFHKFLKEDVETSIPQRFEKTVLKHPYRLAVNDGKKSINYSELNKASNRIAHAILQRTREQGQNIAIVIQHGLDTVSGRRDNRQTIRPAVGEAKLNSVGEILHRMPPRLKLHCVASMCSSRPVGANFQ